MVPYVMFPQYRVYVRYKKEVSPIALLLYYKERCIWRRRRRKRKRRTLKKGVVVSCARVCFLCLLTESKSFLASSKIQHRAKVESDYRERIEDASKRKKRGVLHHLFRV